jgi:hypothetical protein
MREQVSNNIALRFNTCSLMMIPCGLKHVQTLSVTISKEKSSCILLAEGCEDHDHYRNERNKAQNQN